MRSSHNRARIAQRAAARTPSIRPGTVGTNVAMRASTVTTPSGHVKKSTALKLTSTQRDSTGALSDWNRSVEFFTDPRWSQTVTRQNV